MTVKAGHSPVIGLYSHDIILVLFQWIIKQGYRKKNSQRVELVYIICGVWFFSLFAPHLYFCWCLSGCVEEEGVGGVGWVSVFRDCDMSWDTSIVAYVKLNFSFLLIWIRLLQKKKKKKKKNIKQHIQAHAYVWKTRENTQLAFYINQQRAVIGPSAALTGQ